MIDRRQFLRCAGIGMGSMLIGPRIAFAAAPTTRRFVFVIQRGAADGLNIVVPYGDPAYASLRGNLAIDPGTLHQLDGMFGLHPALGQLASMYADKEALFVQAVASPYRDRSHFDGQNVLETGGSVPYQTKDGWMNRLMALLPGAGAQANAGAIAFAPTVPLALRGPINVASYAASGLPAAPDDLLARVTTLYDRDPQLHALWSSAMSARGLAADAGARQDPASVGALAAKFLARDDGPRIAMIETGGWDTHTAQNPRLANQLKALDTMLAALKTGMGSHWADTTVVIATEFGRTAAPNGTGGTDHGTATAAMIVGGAVNGGRVMADWPGLKAASLYQGRDLRPTRGLDSVIAVAAGETFGLAPARVAQSLFRPTVALAPRDLGLVRQG